MANRNRHVMNNNKPKRKILNKPKIPKSGSKFYLDLIRFRSFIEEKVGLGKLAIAGIGTTLGIATAVTLGILPNHDGGDTIAKVVDSHDDLNNNDNEILLMKDGKVVTRIKENTIVYVDDYSENGMNDVLVISDDGRLVSGIISGDCLEKISVVSEDTLEKYNIVYEVLPEDGANIRNQPKVGNDNKVGSIGEGEYILGAEKMLTGENNFLWVPVMYASEDGIQEGYIRSDLLEKVEKKEIEENTANVQEKKEYREKMIVDTSKDNRVPLNLRREKIVNQNNIIEKIPNGSVVYKLSEEPEKSGTRDWVKVEFENEEGEIVTGWVVNGYLKEYNEVIKVVDTSKEDGVNLNVRIAPGKSSEKVAEIQNGTELKIPQFNIDERIIKDKMEWVKIRLSDGTTGYVSYEFLKDKELKTEIESPIVKDKIVQQVLDNRYVNSSGKVIGIDSSTATPEELRRLLQSETGIPSEAKKGGKVYNTKTAQGKISFVYIKLGATAYGTEFQLLEYEKGKEQAKVCEELEIPYGFYYYTTAITEDEARKEAEYIKNLLNDVENRDYNLLPFAIDVELADNAAKDRQNGKDVTNVKAYLANLIEPEVGKTILYTGGRTSSDISGEKILDLERYNAGLETGPAEIWFPAQRSQNGINGTVTQKYINDMSKDAHILMLQTMLDCTVDGTKIDINMIDENEYVKMIKNQEIELAEIRDSKEEGEERG